MALSARGPIAEPLLLLLCAGLVLAGTPAAWAVEEGEVLRLRAEDLAASGRCEEALPVLERARAASPADARIPHVAGQCRIRLRRYDEAVASLEEAKRLDPELPDIDLHLAIARFHFGDLSGAESALAEARARTPERAEVDLYQGLLDLQRARGREAAAALQRARRTDPLAVEPIASYYGGLAWKSADEEARAREALDRVKREAPGSPWAEAAERALAAPSGLRGFRDRRDVRDRQQAERPLGSTRADEPKTSWAIVSAGVEYDDNVVLRGGGVDLPPEISDESDVRGVWTADLGAELFRRDDWAGGIMAAYYGSAHEDLDEFDVHYPTITAWMDRRIGEVMAARLQYDFGYAWVGTDPYLLHHKFVPAFFYQWDRAGTTRLFAEFTWNNFLFSNDDVPDGDPGGVPGDPCPGGATLCGPFGMNEQSARNRDGFGSIIGFDHVFPFEAANSELRGGYRYHRYSSRGREYSHQGHEIWLGTRTKLPFRFIVDLQAGYTYKPYRHSSTYPDPDDLVTGEQYALSGVRRREEVVRFDAILERELTDWLVASVRYGYLDNDSNTEVFDYDRHVVGGFLTVRFYR